MQQDNRRFATEAELRDHLAAAAREHGWRVDTEVSLPPRPYAWGRADLILYRTAHPPVLIECKQDIPGAAALRRSAEQGISYARIYEALHIDRPIVYVVADRVEAGRDDCRFLAGIFDVYARTAEQFLSELVGGPEQMEWERMWERDVWRRSYGFDPGPHPNPFVEAAAEGPWIAAMLSERGAPASSGDAVASAAIYRKHPEAV